LHTYVFTVYKFEFVVQTKHKLISLRRPISAVLGNNHLFSEPLGGVQHHNRKLWLIFRTIRNTWTHCVDKTKSLKVTPSQVTKI